MISDEFKSIGEYCAAGLYEEPDRSLFYRKALGIRRFYENCPLTKYNGELLYPSGRVAINTDIYPHYFKGIEADCDALLKKSGKLADLYTSEFCRYCSTVTR